jgi:hypothetical protein
MHLTGGMPSANALGLGDPVKLDERCSLEAHSPDLRHFRAFSTPERNPALEVLSTTDHPQVSPKGDDVANRWHAPCITR